ncbi:MAG: phenylalanine--tRNA ligase subunit alpha, partial [Acidimicrobiia bacterium]|nr:phenylalanine--tRNA ligase subunit alpha [Acidimicrobiia bacterium]
MESLDALLENAPTLVGGTSTLEELSQAEVELLGRRSMVAEFQRGIGRLPPEERPAVGKAIQEARRTLAKLIKTQRRRLETKSERIMLASDRVDVSLAALEYQEGYTHLITSTIEEVCDIFIGLGYRVVGGPEAESGMYNFDALNTPPPPTHKGG